MIKNINTIYTLIKQDVNDSCATDTPDNVKQAARDGANRYLKEVLYEEAVFSDDHSNEEQAFQDCLQAVTETSFEHLFALAHLSKCLMQPGHTPQWLHEWCSSYQDQDKTKLLGDAFSFSQLKTWQWIEVPVLTYIASSQKTETIRFLAGLDPASQNGKLHLPSWLPLDAKATNQLETAVNTVFNKDPYSITIWPIYPHDAGTITGHSLGLPIAIGLHLLAKGQPWPRGLYATGGMDENGNLLTVGSIAAKKEATRDCEFFVYPFASQDDKPELLQEEIIKAASSADIRHIALLAGQEADGAESLRKWLRLIADPGILLPEYNGLINSVIPPVWPLRMAKENGYLDLFCPRSGQSVCSLKKDEFYNRFIKIVDALESNQANMTIAPVLTDLVEPAVIKECYRAIRENGRLVNLFFRWASLQVAVANHQGKGARVGNDWTQLCEEMLAWDEEQSKTRGKRWIKGKPVLQFLMRDFVGTRFDAFSFHHDIPSNFWKKFSNFGDIITEFGADEPDIVFSYGAACGTIASYYGYRREGKKAREYAEKSYNMFIGNERKYEALRQKQTICFVELDQENYPAALQALAAFLEYAGISQPADLCQGLDMSGNYQLGTLLNNTRDDNPVNWAYRISCLCRYMAQLCRHDHHIVDELTLAWPFFKDVLTFAMTNLAQNFANQHPYQLILYNVGIIADRLGHKEEAGQAWHKSMAICLASGPTIKAMALLSASCLHHEKMLAEEGLNQIKALLNWLGQDDCPLAKEHFAPLITPHKKAVDALQLVRQEPERFFPFDFR